MSGLVYERMRDSLEQLSLHRALECVDSLLDRVASGELSSVDLLDQLLDAELTVRRERSIAMRLKLAGLPTVKTVDAFDFRFQPSIDESLIRDLHTLRFLHAGHNNASGDQSRSCRDYRRRDGSFHNRSRTVR
jgi:DNA replication protein DnaC